jgi:hypothetical protein
MRALHYAALTALALTGCLGTPASSSSGSGSGSGSGGSGEPLTIDLSVSALEDVNASSETFGMQLHPGDYTGQVSVWYFGHST